MTALTPQQMRSLADRVRTTGALEEVLAWEDTEKVDHALRTAADQLDAVQAVLSEAHDKFVATYDAECMTGRGPSSIGVAGAPLASSVLRALDLLRAKATANIERLTADTAPREDRDDCGTVTEDPTPTFCTKLRGHDGAHNTDGVV